MDVKMKQENIGKKQNDDQIYLQPSFSWPKGPAILVVQNIISTFSRLPNV